MERGPQYELCLGPGLGLVRHWEQIKWRHALLPPEAELGLLGCPGYQLV